MKNDFIDFDVNGIEKLEKEFKNLDQKVGTKLIKKANRAGAKILLKEMKARVPVGTGTLKKSLGILVGKMKGKGSRLKVGARRGKNQKHDGFHAHFIEFGTVAHFIKKKGEGVLSIFGKVFGKEIEHPGSKAKPFMRPAADAKASEVVQAIGKELGKLIEDQYK